MYTYCTYNNYVLCTFVKHFSSSVFTSGEYAALNPLNNWGALKCTWCRGRRSCQQDPECLRRPASSRAEQPEHRGWATCQLRSRGQTARINSVPSCSTKRSLSTYSPSNQSYIERHRLSISPPSPFSHLSWVVLRLQGSRRPRVSPSHFLGKPEQLPAIQRRTEHLKMVEHSPKKHKHTPPMSAFFPESIVDSHTGCDEERLHPPYKSFDWEKRWWSHGRCLTLMNICVWCDMCGKHREKLEFWLSENFILEILLEEKI